MKTFKFILTAIVILSFSGLAAAQDEEITLTTYYPAPYGDYDNLRTDTIAVNKIAVGGTTVPVTDGVIGFASRATEPPANVSRAGDLYFDGTEFKYYKVTSTSTIDDEGNEVIETTGAWTSVGAMGGGGLQNMIFATATAGDGWETETNNTDWQVIDGLTITQNFTNQRVFIIFEASLGINAPTSPTNAHVALFINGNQLDTSRLRADYNVFGNSVVLTWAGLLNGANTIHVAAKVNRNDSRLQTIPYDTPRLAVLR
jgi:hypothetical protein